MINLKNLKFDKAEFWSLHTMPQPVIKYIIHEGYYFLVRNLYENKPGLESK